LKAELEKVKRNVHRIPLPHTAPHPSEAGKEVLAPEGRAQLDELRDQLVDYTAAHQGSGALAYAGTFCSGDEQTTRQLIWATSISTDELLKLNDNRMVEKVLASVGNHQRLAILLLLLQKPLTVNQLVEASGANTTGQIYHHLKPLVAADTIQEDHGVYAVIPHRVQGIIMLLAGVWDLIDNRYTSGTWDEADHNE
jgi:DNA-binding transcriptional ArsR family regulator